MTSETLQPDDYLQLSAIYGLLGRLWIREVDSSMLAALIEPNLRSAFEKLGGQVPEEVSSEVIDQLAEDYCQLLVGPQGHAPPVQSIWADARYQSRCAADVQRYYELIPGFVPAGNIPDHFGNQLQFMAEVFLRSAPLSSDNPYETVAATFFEDHLKWAIPLMQRVQSQAKTDFYRGLARMTETLLESES